MRYNTALVQTMRDHTNTNLRQELTVQLAIEFGELVVQSALLPLETSRICEWISRMFHVLSYTDWVTSAIELPVASFDALFSELAVEPYLGTNPLCELLLWAMDDNEGRWERTEYMGRVSWLEKEAADDEAPKPTVDNHITINIRIQSTYTQRWENEAKQTYT